MAESVTHQGSNPQEIINVLRDEQPGPIESLDDLGDGSRDLTIGKILVAANLPPNGAGKK